MQGTIFFAHGSRDPLWRKPVEAIAVRTRELAPAMRVECAYLELTQPDIFTCVHGLAVQGVLTITIVPLFLGVGKHAREDLPKLLAELMVKHPTIRFAMRPAIGEDDQVVDLIARIALREPRQPL